MANYKDLKQLKRITLKCQGLSNNHPFGKGKKAVLSAIEQLGYVQIDTLSVVERSHHHTLYSRISDYKKEYLEQLVKERNVFEYWFHAASYLPINDFRYALPLMRRFKEGNGLYYKNVDQKTLDYVYDKIRVDGPQKARDFKSITNKPGSWWNWKPAKVALEKLFMQGDLMVCGRNGMEKIYDLTQNVLPNTINTTEPTPLEFANYLVKTHLRAYGVTSLKQITHLRTGKELKNNVELILQTMLDDKTIQAINNDDSPTLFALSECLESTLKKTTPKIHLLSPFDNAIIHRERLEHLFKFNFRLECYVPKEKRQFGYFCLPILFGDEFIGRVDCKAHRKEGVLELIHLHIENRLTTAEIWLNDLVKTIKEFAVFNNCQSIKISNTSPNEFKTILEKEIEQ